MKRRLANFAGSAFAVLITGAVLYWYGGDLRGIDLQNPAVLAGVAGSIALYVLVILIGACAWRILLKAFGAKPARWAAERQLLIAQIAKYIPGNVAQYAGRAAMTIQSGVPVRAAGMALVTETAVIIAGGFLSVAISITLFPGLAESLQRILPDSSAIVWLGTGVGTFFLVLLVAAGLGSRVGKFPKVKPAYILLASVCSTVTFLLLGVSLHLVVAAVSATPVPISLCVAVFAAAWIAGLATPGAPGGIGVRESVLVLGLAPLTGGAAALSAALLHRGVSVIGDLISFGFGLLLRRAAKTPAENSTGLATNP